MTLPPAPYARARVFTTLITTLVWAVLLFVFTGFSKEEYASPVGMANFTAVAFMFIPYFATHGVLMSMMNGVVKGSIIMPESAKDASGGGGTDNPWRLATINAFAFGLIPSGLGYFLAINVAPNSMTPRAFGIRYTLAGTALAAIVTWIASGRPFLRTMGMPIEKRAYVGTPDQYLMRYFALPHGIANTIINAALAFALSPVPFAQAGAIVPTAHIVFDTAATCLILTWLIASGSKSQARVETLLGIAPPAAASQKSVMNALMTTFFAGLGFTVVVGVILWLTKTPGLDVFSWAAYRGVVFGVYAGWLAKNVAQAAINTALHPEAAASPASSQAA